MTTVSASTIVLVAEDLLGSWLQDGLEAAGYHVRSVLPEAAETLHGSAPVNLLIGEIRYPIEQHLTRVLALRQQWADMPPVILLGAAPAILPSLAPGVAWMPPPIQRDALIELVQTMLARR